MTLNEFLALYQFSKNSVIHVFDYVYDVNGNVDCYQPPYHYADIYDRCVSIDNNFRDNIAIVFDYPVVFFGLSDKLGSINVFVRSI